MLKYLRDASFATPVIKRRPVEVQPVGGIAVCKTKIAQNVALV